MPTTAIPDGGSTGGTEPAGDATLPRSRTTVPAISLEHFGQMAAIALGVLYAAGFVIVNSYLKNFEILKFEVLRSRYVAAGLIFILTCGPPPIFLCHLMMVARRRSAFFVKGASRRARLAFYARYAAVGVAFSIVIWTGVVNSVTTGFLWSTSFFTAWIGITLMGSLPWVFYLLISRTTDEYESSLERANDRGMMFMLALISIFFIATLFADEVFEHVNPEFGGGMGWYARTVASSDSMPTTVRAILGSRPSVIVDRDERSMVLLTCNGDLTSSRPITISEISQSSVSALLVFGPITHENFIEHCRLVRSGLRAKAGATPPGGGGASPARADSQPSTGRRGAPRRGDVPPPDSTRGGA